MSRLGCAPESNSLFSALERSAAEAAPPWGMGRTDTSKNLAPAQTGEIRRF